jgi:Flp pilus assembly protein TadD
LDAAVGKPGPSTATKDQAASAAKEINDKGIFSYNTGRYADAVRSFHAAVEASPDNAVYRNNLALALMRAGKIDDAALEFLTSLKLRADYPEAMNNYGSLLAASGDHSRALEYYGRATGLDAGYAEPNLNAAVSYEQTGRVEEAIRSYERFLRLTDDSSLSEKVRKKVARLRASLIIRDRASATGEVR